jgi:hypothetical protein
VFTLCFSPTRSLDSWLGVHYRRGGREFFILQVFQLLLVLKMSDEGLPQETQKANLSINLGVKSVDGNWRLEGTYSVMWGLLDLLTMEINQVKNARR